MLKQEMSKKLSEQLNMECFSSNLYLQMSAWCHDKCFQGATQFFRMQSKEEMSHMWRLFDYINDTSSAMPPILGMIDAPPTNFLSLSEVMHHAYKHEKMITEKINDLSHMSMTLQDYSTFHFLQWYVMEQHKEEKILKCILDKFTLVNMDNSSILFFIDQDLKGISHNH